MTAFELKLLAFRHRDDAREHLNTAKHYRRVGAPNQTAKYTAKALNKWRQYRAEWKAAERLLA
jgi:hypothetical protein